MVNGYRELWLVWVLTSYFNARNSARLVNDGETRFC